MSIKDRFLVVSFCVLAFFGVVSSWLWVAVNYEMTYARSNINAHSHRLDVIEELYNRSSDRWTGSEMRAWVTELKRLNPGLKLPEIQNK